MFTKLYDTVENEYVVVSIIGDNLLNHFTDKKIQEIIDLKNQESYNEFKENFFKQNKHFIVQCQKNDKGLNLRIINIL